MNIVIDTLFWLGVLGLITLIYAAITAYKARIETQHAPRVEMVECHTGRHGPYPKRNAMITEELGDKHPICPICFEMAMKQAKVNVSQPNKHY